MAMLLIWPLQESVVGFWLRFKGSLALGKVWQLLAQAALTNQREKTPLV
jgi:hypothetical protein